MKGQRQDCNHGPDFRAIAPNHTTVLLQRSAVPDPQPPDSTECAVALLLVDQQDRGRELGEGRRSLASVDTVRILHKEKN